MIRGPTSSRASADHRCPNKRQTLCVKGTEGSCRPHPRPTDVDHGQLQQCSLQHPSAGVKLPGLRRATAPGSRVLCWYLPVRHHQAHAEGQLPRARVEQPEARAAHPPVPWLVQVEPQDLGDAHQAGPQSQKVSKIAKRNLRKVGLEAHVLHNQHTAQISDEDRGRRRGPHGQ